MKTNVEEAIFELDGAVTDAAIGNVGHRYGAVFSSLM
jgi:hypothetical protein